MSYDLKKKNGRTDEKSQAEPAALVLMHPLHVVLIGEMAEAAGKRRSSRIDILTGFFCPLHPEVLGWCVGVSLVATGQGDH